MSCRLGDGVESDVIIEAAEETLARIIMGSLDADMVYFSGGFGFVGPWQPHSG